MALQSETDQFEKQKKVFASQNLLMKTIKDVVDADVYTRLVNGLQLESWRAGEMVIKKGDKGDKLYFVNEGKVTCFEKEDGPNTDLGVNSYFGERALLSESKLRTMNVKACVDSQLYSLSAGTIEDILSTEFEKIL